MSASPRSAREQTTRIPASAAILASTMSGWPIAAACPSAVLEIPARAPGHLGTAHMAYVSLRGLSGVCVCNESPLGHRIIPSFLQFTSQGAFASELEVPGDTAVVLHGSEAVS